jgi:ribosomal protein L7/L12
MFEVQAKDKLVQITMDHLFPQQLNIFEVNELIERLETARERVAENVRQQEDRRATFLVTLSLAGEAMKAGNKIGAIVEVRRAFTKLYPEGSGVGLWEAKSIVEAFAND